MKFFQAILFLLSSTVVSSYNTQPLLEFLMANDKNEVEKPITVGDGYRNNIRKRKLKGKMYSLPLERKRVLKDKEPKEEDPKEKDKTKEKSKEPKEESPKTKTEKTKSKEKSKKETKIKSKKEKSKTKSPKASPPPKPNQTEAPNEDIGVDGTGSKTPTSAPTKPVTRDQIDNTTQVNFSCPERSVANETNATTPNETNTTVTYKYSLETTTDVSDEIEQNLKRNMFDAITSDICPSRRLSSFEEQNKARLHRRRRLELVEMKSAVQDTKAGSCEPEASSDNVCTEYESKIEAKIDDVGKNSNADEITNSILKNLNAYAENTDFKSTIDESIVGVKVLTKMNEEEREPPSTSSAEKGGSKVGGFVGMGVALAILGAVLYVLIRKRQQREGNEEVLHAEAIEVNKKDKYGEASAPSKGTTAQMEDSVVWAEAEIVR